MTFVKGQKKPLNSGRKPGTPNIKRLPGVEQFLSEKDINPISEILKLIPLVPPNDQLKAWFNILSYVQHKPKENDESYSELSNELEMERQKAIEFFKNVPPKVHTLLIREAKAELTASSATGTL